MSRLYITIMPDTTALVKHKLVVVAKPLLELRTVPKKNPAAVALGRLGGKVGGRSRMEQMSADQRAEFASSGGKAGGKARAQKLSQKRRSDIARKAAVARWVKARSKSQTD